ncbi:hypothetical protein KAH55_12590, partial [bacterium]|nr:hypothetical protein [bacterium]
GRDMTLVSEATPLPQTFQTGLGLYVGSHNSFQINLSADYRKIRDEDGFITFGTEFSWRQFASIRFGFNYENERLVETFTIGGSLRLDDVIWGSSMVGQNRALRMDLALNEGNPFFDSPYHGTATYFPLQPEHFRRYLPANGTVIDTSIVNFSWEKTRDPDLYDDVRTWLLVDTDSTRLDTLMRKISTRVDVNSAETEHAILLHQEVTSQKLTLDNFSGDLYYWTVLAQDRDFHARYGTENKQKISKFTVTRPNLKIDRIEFEYSPWITTDPYQGEIKIHISNYGNRIGRSFYLDVVDSTLHADSSKVIWPRLDIPDLAPGETTVLQASWNTSLAGLHEFIGRIRWSNSALMFEGRDQFYSIPKGYLFSPDSVMALELKRIQFNLPIVGKVFFDSSSSVLQAEFFKWQTEVEPLLVTLAKRMIRYQNVTIQIQGAYDPNSDRGPVSLARERTETVRDKLVELGVHPSRMRILPDNVLLRSYTPTDPLDALRYFEDRRVVNIVTAEANEEKLFEPMISFFDSQRTFSVPFGLNIRTVVPSVSGELLLSADTLATSVGVPGIESLRYIEKIVDWHLPDLAKTKNSIWLNKSLQYHIELDDSLNRHFRSHPLEVAVHERLMPMERLVWLIAIFAEAKPYYNFYWANLLDNIPFLTQTENARFRFIGHGCAIGPSIVNKILSEQRGTLFSELFLNDVKRLYPGLHQDIKTHMDPPQGHGENEPLEFLSTEGQSVLLGDNNLPSGRQKNRRVLVHFYRKMK